MEFKYKDIVFNNKLVLNKGCIEFNKGQITIITGESGSGKTTLFRLMTKGNDGWKDLDLYQNVSTCPQEPVFLEGLTIREHIEYIEKLTDCHISLDNYVEKLHLNELMDMYPSQLSGGEQKRVAFLLCMAKDVDIYILDEPTSSLNNAYSKIYCDILNLLIEKGKGIVLFTHDEKLLSIGNIKYHIKDKILNTVSNEKKETEYSLSQHISKNLNKTSPAFFTMRKKQKIYVKILHFMITFSIAMVAFGYSFSRDVLDIHHSYSQKISSNEITVYKSTAQAIHDGVADYTFNHEVPLKDKDIKKIANLDNIETVEWRYDCLEPNYEFNEDIKEVSYDPENAKHDYTISIIKNEQELAQVNIEDNIIYKFSKNYSKLLNINYYTDKINNTILLLKEFITDSIILLVSYYTFSLIMNSKVTVGDYMTISFLSSYSIYPFRNIIDLIYEYHYVKNSIRRANDFFDIEDEKIYEDKRLEVNGNIKIVNLSYTFNNKYYVLKNINLFIKDKDRVLLLGSSGSGKSTILKLLYKYLQADRNKIFINNYDINDYSMSDIRSSITYVSQNELLFNDTIRNNILLDRDVREVDYLNICKILHIDDIVKDNILGYDYILEENGINISGGQRQRIILARSLLKNSKIIMIDEGFNQIDIKLEREILLDIFRYFHDRTFIIISHRIENSDLYNRVIKIDNGFVNMIEEVYNE